MTASSSAIQDASITFSCTPDGVPLGLVVAGLHQHPGDRVGAVRALEDADLVVDQVELGQVGVGPLERGAQRPVERVDRTVALAGRDQPLALGLQLDGGLARDGAVRAPLDDHPPRLDREVPASLARDHVAHQQLEGRVRGLERPPLRLEVLHLADDRVHLRRASGRSRAACP